MGILLLQEKIENLQSLADSLLHIGDKDGYIYADDLSQLNQKIHNQIDELYPQCGKTAEQEAALCLAILKGYSVSLYANPKDEAQRRNILKRSRIILTNVLSPTLKEELLTVYQQY